MTIDEARIMNGEVVTSTPSSSRYHAGECHSQAYVIYILERAQHEAGERETK